MEIVTENQFDIRNQRAPLCAMQKFPDRPMHVCIKRSVFVIFLCLHSWACVSHLDWSTEIHVNTTESFQKTQGRLVTSRNQSQMTTTRPRPNTIQVSRKKNVFKIQCDHFCYERHVNSLERDLCFIAMVRDASLHRVIWTLVMTLKT